MIFDILDICSILLEAFIFLGFFHTISKKELFNKKIKLLAYVIFIILNSTIILITDNMMIRFIVLIISIFSLSNIYEMKRSISVFLIFIVMIVLVLCELIVGLVSSSISNLAVGVVLDNEVYYAIGIFVSKLLGLFFVKVFEYKYKPQEVDIPLIWYLIFFSFPIVTLFIGIVFAIGFGIEVSGSIATVGSISIALLSFTNILIYYLFENYATQVKKQNIVLLQNEKLERDKVYYEEMILKQDNSNKVMHDLKNELYAIKYLLKNDSIEAKKQIDQICEIVEANKSIIYTSNKSVDALINSKKMLMEKHNIKFLCESFVSDFKSINDVDLCILIGNLLDNAIEASVKMEQSIIDLSFNQINNYIAIEIINDCLEDVEINNIKTTKKNKEIHGYGLKSVKNIVSKYDGTISISSKNKKFDCLVMLKQ